MGRNVETRHVSSEADSGEPERRSRLVALLAAGVARLLADEAGAVKADVDLSGDVRVTTTTARPGVGDES